VMIDEQHKIVAVSYDFNGERDFNITIHHPEGSFEFGWDAVRRRQKCGAESKTFRQLPYAKKKAWLLKRLGDNVGPDEELPWAGGVKAMDEWLDGSDDSDYEECSSGWANEYLVGHPIHDALTPEEREAWGIHQVDACSMASGPIMAVRVECSLNDLNTLLQQKRLPFLVVKDNRPKVSPTSPSRR
jgi:hypothetical protein